MSLEFPNTEDEEWVVCPYCGHKHGDAWEWCTSEEPHETKCDNCGQVFQCYAEYSTTYHGVAS